MCTIWNLIPAGPLADAVAPHLDRAGVSYTITDAPSDNGTAVFLCGGLRGARAIARAIIEADGKVFVSETPGECPDMAVRLGLFPADTRWDTPMTREEAAVLAVRLLEQRGAL